VRTIRRLGPILGIHFVQAFQPALVTTVTYFSMLPPTGRAKKFFLNVNTFVMALTLLATVVAVNA
jgi:hypothetical protein